MRPYLYTLIDEADLCDMLKSFQACIGIPIQVIDKEGNILVAYGGQACYCKRLMPFLPKTDSCAKQHIDAAKRSVELGEPYIFACHANLNHVVFPLLYEGSFLGAVLAGPFLLDTPDSTILAEVAGRYTLPANILLELYDDLGALRVIAPSSATQISKLLFYLFSGMMVNARQQLDFNRTKQHQQAKISESIQMYKTCTEVDAGKYPYEKEKELISKVKAGEITQANGILNDLLGYVLFSEGNKLDGIKARAVELTSLLSRAAIEGGATPSSILKMNNNFLTALNRSEDFDLLCMKLQEIVEDFTASVFRDLPAKNTDVIKRVKEYVSKHFSERISLEEAAEHVHLNPAYFSALFSQSTGQTFKEYVNTVRIEEAMRLLKNTDYAILDIAVAVGLGDQSYFSKVFKKHTGLTPRQYR